MDFKDQIKQLATRIEKMKDQVKTEEATKNAFIMPFIQCLGYDVFNPLEVVPEFTADFGIKQGEKVDYAILKDSQPAILIECKCHLGKLDLHDSQLFRYFSTTKAKFGLLTNGIEFRFYTDLVEVNRMDQKPFFIFNITDIKDNQIEELKKFHKTYYNLDTIINAASELKYISELRNTINDEINNPSPEFVKHFAKQIYPSIVTQKIIDLFTILIKKTFSQYINDLITERLKSALQKESEQQSAEVENEIEESKNKTITTEEEIESFFIIKSILHPIIDVGRIYLRDNQTYCAILMDDNNRKPLARLYFNGSKKYLGLFDKEKNEKKHQLFALNDIYTYSDDIKRLAENYEEK